MPVTLDTMNAMKTLALGLVWAATWFSGMTAAEEAGTELPARPFHLEGKNGKRWDVTFTVSHGPFHGVVYYAVPPDDPCQTIESVELHADTKKGRVDAARVADAGPYKKPLLKLEVQAAAPFTAVAHVVVQFHHTKLELGAPAGKVKTPGPLVKKEYMNDGWPNDQARTWFTQWMKSHKLIRHDEDEADFAFRVLKFLQQNFRYVIPDDIAEHKAMVAKNPEMGDWHYTIKTSTGECWRISDTYCRIMRMNGIPARLVSGNYIIGDKGHHVRSLIYLTDVGWVPIEATSAVSSPKEPTLNFFGTWGGGMLIGNRNIDFELPGPKGNGSIGTLDQLAFGGADGKWDFPAAEIKVTELPPKG
jgi:hypothetical protein